MSETPNLIKIKVIGTTGISYNIPIEKSQNINIRKLKEIISERCCIPVNVFNLSLNGKILIDDKKLDFYSIDDKSIIHCIENTEGGKLI